MALFQCCKNTEDTPQENVLVEQSSVATGAAAATSAKPLDPAPVVSEPIAAPEPAPEKAPAATPAAPAGLFLVRLDKKAMGLDSVGLDISAKDHVINIAKVTGGMMSRWNEENPSFQVCAGDSIVKVNGIMGDLQLMLNTIKKAETMEMLIRKANFPAADVAKTPPASPRAAAQPSQGAGLFIITLDRKAMGVDTVGMDITAKDHLINVAKVTGGMTGKWNEANPSMQVCAGDSVLKVNGVRGDLQLMLSMIKKADVLEMLVQKA